jgi:hypothetical protein
MTDDKFGHFVAAATTAATVILSNGDALAAEQFDGRWTLTLKCPKAPDGAKAYTHIFDVNVKDGMLDGDYVVPGQNNGHFHLNGPIRPDGSAYLHMSGETGKGSTLLDTPAQAHILILISTLNSQPHKPRGGAYNNDHATRRSQGDVIRPSPVLLE